MPSDRRDLILHLLALELEQVLAGLEQLTLASAVAVVVLLKVVLVLEDELELGAKALILFLIVAF